MATLPGVSVGLALESAEFTTGMARAQRQMDGFAANVRRSSGAMRAGFAGLGFQVQDFVVQVGSGTSALRAFAQQAPQALGAFGPVGIALGTVAALAASLAPTLFDLGRGTRDADRAAKDFAATQEALKAFLDDSTSSINDQAAAISRLTGAQREPGSKGWNCS